MRNMVIITGLVIVHNLFAHWVLLTNRDRWFRSSFNMAFYLIECSLLVLLTGAEESTAFAVYILLIIGFIAYSRRLADILGFTLACCGAYGVVVLIELYAVGLAMPPGMIVVRFILIAMAGWVTARIGDQLWTIEEGYVSQTQALASSEALLRTTLNTAADPIIVFDDNELITDANEHACDFLGVPHHELQGQRFRSFLFDDGTLPTKIAALRSRGETMGEEIVLSAEGEERHVELMIRSFIRDGRRFFVAVMHDITDRKQLQESNRIANANLEHLNQEIRKLDNLKAGFFVTMSQRVRSPLSAVLGYIEMLLGEELGEITFEQQQALQTCRKSILRIFRLIDEAQDFGPSGAKEGLLDESFPPHFVDDPDVSPPDDTP